MNKADISVHTIKNIRHECTRYQQINEERAIYVSVT